MCNVFLILLGQHWTGQNPMQFCLRGSIQYCIRKNPVQCCLNILGTILHRSKVCAMLSEKLQTTLHKKKILCNIILIPLGQLHTTKPYAMLSERVQTALYKKRSCAILFQFSWDNIAQVKNLWNVVWEALDNFAQEKILWNAILMLLGQHFTDQNFMQCCPRGSRQHYIRKNPV